LPGPRSPARRDPTLQQTPIPLKLLPGVTLVGDLRDPLWYILWKYGYFPRALVEDQMLFKFLRPGDTVWDVGANIGYLALLFARAVGPTGKVYSFEPGRRVLPDLRRTVAREPQLIEILELAASDQDGEARFHEDSDSTDRSTLASAGPDGYVVKTARLDTVWRERGLRMPDVLKIDVEGHEAAVLRGSAELIRQTRPLILFESLDTRLRDENIAAIREIAGAETYEFRRIARSGPLVPALLPGGDELTVNYFAMLPEHRDRFREIEFRDRL
jgi:FkbM family methyltransferase